MRPVAIRRAPGLPAAILLLSIFLVFFPVQLVGRPCHPAAALVPTSCAPRRACARLALILLVILLLLLASRLVVAEHRRHVSFEVDLLLALLAAFLLSFWELRKGWGACRG